MTANKFALHRTNPGLKTLALRSLGASYQLSIINDQRSIINQQPTTNNQQLFKRIKENE